MVIWDKAGWVEEGVTHRCGRLVRLELLDVEILHEVWVDVPVSWRGVRRVRGCHTPFRATADVEKAAERENARAYPAI